MYVRTVFLACMDSRLRGNDAEFAIRRQVLARTFAPVTRFWVHQKRIDSRVRAGKARSDRRGEPSANSPDGSCAVSVIGRRQKLPWRCRAASRIGSGSLRSRWRKRGADAGTLGFPPSRGRRRRNSGSQVQTSQWKHRGNQQKTSFPDAAPSGIRDVETVCRKELVYGSSVRSVATTERRPAPYGCRPSQRLSGRRRYYAVCMPSRRGAVAIGSSERRDLPSKNAPCSIARDLWNTSPSTWLEA